MDEWAICTIQNNKRYFLVRVLGQRFSCTWTTNKNDARLFESKPMAEYFAATRHVRMFHIRKE